MNKVISLFLLLLIICTGCEKNQTVNRDSISGSITFSGAWALYPMVIKWAEEYKKNQPGIRIDVSAGGAGKGMADVLSDIVDIGNVSREIFPGEIEKGAWWISVAKDAVVPTINEKNPYAQTILTCGISKEEFQDIWITEKVKIWDTITETRNKDNINMYTRSDSCGAAQTWALYLGANQEDLLGIGVYGDPGLAEAVRKDIFGIGFNNINYAYDAGSGKPVSGLSIVPIDLNANNRIDPDESFYTTRDEIIEAISKDVYPSPPARLLHFVCHGEPKKEHIKRFLEWILTEGQKYVLETGYIPVENKEIERGLSKLK